MKFHGGVRTANTRKRGDAGVVVANWLAVGTGVLSLVACGKAADDRIASRKSATLEDLPSNESPFPGAIAGEERIKAAGDVGLPNSVVRQVAWPAPAATEDLGGVIGVYSENGVVGRYTWVLKPEPVTDIGGAHVKPSSGVPGQVRPRIAQDVEAAMKQASPGQRIPVIVRLSWDFQSPLSQIDYANIATFDAPPKLVSQAAEKDALLAARQQEAAVAQAPLIDWLASSGLDPSGFWIVNAVSVSVPSALVPALANRPDVQSVELDAKLSLTDATVWDGNNAKQTNGLNAGYFVANGYDGGRYNPVNNDYLSVAVMDFNFNTGHPVFLDFGAGPTRVRSTWTCNVNPCVAGVPGGADVHGSLCASAAAGDAMDFQIAGTDDYRRDRTGLAEEADLIFISTGAIGDTIRGLQKAVSLKADVVSESFGGADAVCDGFYSGYEGAVYDAHQAGVLVVGSAGNNNEAARTGACKLTGLSEVPSQLVVGGLTDPGGGAYATSSIWASTSRGGVNVTIGGSLYNEAFTGVDVLVPAFWGYGAWTGSSFIGVGGTSLAAPQVAGAALLFKDWLIAGGGASAAAVPGLVFANMVAMGDRATSNTTYRSTGFDVYWGAGRFQERYYALPDEPTGTFRWETAWYTMSNAQHILHHVGGIGNEPAGIQTFKAYAVFFERDGADVADIDMTVKDLDCGVGASVLGSDSSRDYKSMVKLGYGAAGKALCVDLYGYHVPPGETRSVLLVIYYTSATSMR